jgi:CDGSH-type Zn-finger protein
MKEEKAVFKVMPGGPLKISGSFEITLPGKGIVEQKKTVFLCRCGGSSNKPYCDGTHKRNGFSD